MGKKFTNLKNFLRRIHSFHNTMCPQFPFKTIYITTIDASFFLFLQYTYLLTSQLESQRHFFEEKMAFIESEAMKNVSHFR